MTVDVVGDTPFSNMSRRNLKDVVLVRGGTNPDPVPRELSIF